MSCKICKRGACAAWMHGRDEQALLAEREAMTDDVDSLRREVQELRAEVAELKQRLEAQK